MRKESVPTSILLLYHPSQAADRIKQNPKFWPPFLLSCLIVSIIGAYLGYMAPYVDLTLIEPDETIRFVSVLMSIVFWFLGLLFGAFVLLIESMLLFIILRLTTKKKISFPMLLTFSAYLSLFLEPIVFLVHLWVNPMLDGPFITGLAYWIPSTGILAAILDQIELIAIWQTVLVFFALRQLADLSNRQAVMVTGIFTLFFVLLGIGMYQQLPI